MSHGRFWRQLAFVAAMVFSLGSSAARSEETPSSKGAERPAAGGAEMPAATNDRSDTTAVQEHPMTLAQAIDSALRRNEQIVIGSEALTAAEAGTRGAAGAYDPLLSVSGGWSRTSEPINSLYSGAPDGQTSPTDKSANGALSIRQLLPTGGELTVSGQAARETTNGTASLLTPAYSTQIGAALRQPLLRGLGDDAAPRSLRQARADRQGASASLRTTVSEVVTSVERAYWSLIAARLQVGVLDEAVRLAREQLAETDTRVHSGSAPETELAQPRAELERRTGDLLAARENVSRSENGLKLLILGDGDALWPERIRPVDTAEVEIHPVDLPAALERALKNRPELAAQQAALDRKRAESAFAHNAVQPSLDAVLSYDRFGLAGTRNPALPDVGFPAELSGNLGQSFHTLGEGDFSTTSLALQLEFPIRNRTALAAAVAARSAERQALADLAIARNNVRAEVLDAVAALETAGQRITAARSAREAAEIQLSAEQDRYKVGLSTNFLVLTRQNDLSQARLQEISALTDYRNARAEMARATGSVIEERGIDLRGNTP